MTTSNKNNACTDPINTDQKTQKMNHPVKWQQIILYY